MLSGAPSLLWCAEGRERGDVLPCGEGEAVAQEHREPSFDSVWRKPSEVLVAVNNQAAGRSRMHECFGEERRLGPERNVGAVHPPDRRDGGDHTM